MGISRWKLSKKRKKIIYDEFMNLKYKTTFFSIIIIITIIKCHMFINPTLPPLIKEYLNFGIFSNNPYPGSHHPCPCQLHSKVCPLFGGLFLCQFPLNGLWSGSLLWWHSNWCYCWEHLHNWVAKNYKFRRQSNRLNGKCVDSPKKNIGYICVYPAGTKFIFAYIFWQLLAKKIHKIKAKRKQKFQQNEIATDGNAKIWMREF